MTKSIKQNTKHLCDTTGKLTEIIKYKIKEVEERKKRLSQDKMIEKLKNKKIEIRDFYKALNQKNETTLIAEIKKASPTLGNINLNINVEKQAIEYTKAGANAISVLTDEKFFKGDLKYLKKIKKITNLPILQKDFIIDPYQIYEAKYYGADAILLISSVLKEDYLNELVNLTHKLGLKCLVETHSKKDIEKALKTKAKIIGINARNLETFKIDLKNIIRLSPLVLSNHLLVAESGIKTREDVLKLKKAGVNCILVGTTLMQASDVGDKIKELKLKSSPKIKICGITSLSNALEISKLKVDYLGFIINYPKSPRNISPERVADIIKKIKAQNKTIKFVGIFLDEPVENVKKIIKKCKLDIVQLHGDESPVYCSELKNLAEVWKSIIVKDKEDIEKIKIYQDITDKILLDAGCGSGKQINHKLLKKLKIDILAGGIGLDNIQEVIKKINPKIIDLNSKVEITPGKKDVGLIKKITKLI